MEFTMVNGSTYLIVKNGASKELLLVPPTLRKTKSEPKQVTLFMPKSYVKPARVTLRERIRLQNNKSRVKDSILAAGIFAMSFIKGLVAAVY